MTISRILVPFLAMGLAYSGAVSAQDDDGHALINVRTTVVKPGTGLEYQELMGQLAASRKAAGHTGVNMWQVVRGPVGTFYSVTNVDNYGVFDTAFDSGMNDADWQRWIGRITDIIDHSTLVTYRTHPELAIAGDPDTPVNMMQLRFSTVEVGGGGDHHEWLAESLVPNMKEGNTRGWTVVDARLGGDVNLWISAQRIDSWSQLDEPGPFSHMSQRARNNMLEGYSDRVVSARTEIIRHLPELSY